MEVLGNREAEFGFSYSGRSDEDDEGFGHSGLIIRHGLRGLHGEVWMKTFTKTVLIRVIRAYIKSN